MRTGAGGSSRGAAVLAPVLHRRRGGPGGDAGEPAAAGARVRRYQPVVRGDGAVVATLRGHLHPPQHRRRPALQVRAARIRRLHRGEAVQPELVDRGHPVAYRQDVATQARSDVVCGRRLPGRPQRRHPAAAGVDQLRSVARDRRVRRIRPRRREDTRGHRLAVQLHQGAGRTQLRQDLRPLPRSRVDAAIPRPAARSAGAGQGRQTSCAAEDVVRSRVADSAGDTGDGDGFGVRRCC